MTLFPSSDNHLPLTPSHLDDIKAAASRMLGAKRREFQAEMTLKYCAENPRQAEMAFGWNRHSVELGLHEKRTGIVCLDMRKNHSGRKSWEKNQSEAAKILWELSASHSQQDPTFRTTLSYTRLTAREARDQMRARGVQKDSLPSPSTMAEVLNRNGYRLRPVLKAKPQKKIPETDAIFGNIREKDGKSDNGMKVKRLSIDCKAVVTIGEYSRGGETRGDNQALDHDMGCKEKYTPFGVLDEDGDQLRLIFGGSAKTSDFIMDGLYSWWKCLPLAESKEFSVLQVKVDNGPESSGCRTQFLKRMVEFTDHIGKTVQLLYYPPYHSKYNPIERCWGILEKHWNGAKLITAETMLKWAESMTWKGIHPVVELSRKVYEKGVSLTKATMRKVEARLKRNPALPKWDILIRPVSQSS